MSEQNHTYIPVKKKRTFWNGRLWHQTKFLTRQLTTTTPGQICITLVLYIVSYNIVMRYLKGKDHPINRYTWRKMEARGELSDDLLTKRDRLEAYISSRTKLEGIPKQFKG